MNISLRELYILMECAKFVLRVKNAPIGITNESICEAVNRIVDKMNKVEIEVKIKAKKAKKSKK